MNRISLTPSINDIFIELKTLRSRKVDIKLIYNKSPEQIEYDHLNIDSDLSNKLRYALNDLWAVNPQLPITFHNQILDLDELSKNVKTLQWHRNQTLTSNISRKKYEIPPTLGKLPFGKQERGCCFFQWISKK